MSESSSIQRFTKARKIMSSTTNDKINSIKMLTPAVRDSPFVQQEAVNPLRVTCYGSSSSKTPLIYQQVAYQLGYILAKRGHTCVNGAGSFGCMSAMNDGAAAGNGHIVGVIHEMWLVDQQDWQSTGDTSSSIISGSDKKIPLQKDRSLRDGGAHPVFNNNNNKKNENQNGPIREMLVAGGRDLQERKRLLVDNAQALVVLPGGPGTWDELWEAACARNIGLQTSLPIVCINVNNYYEPFRAMLQRAYNDKLTKLQPDEIIHFEDTAEAAVRWIEEIQTKENRGAPKVELKQRAETLRTSSFLGGATGSVGGGRSWSASFRQSLSRLKESFYGTSMMDDDFADKMTSDVPSEISTSVAFWIFTAGIGTGLLLHRVVTSHRTR